MKKNQVSATSAVGTRGGGRVANCGPGLVPPEVGEKGRGEDEEKPRAGAASRSEKPEKISPGLPVSDPAGGSPESLPRAPRPPTAGSAGQGERSRVPPAALSPAARRRGPGGGFPSGLTLKLKIIYNTIFVTARNT